MTLLGEAEVPARRTDLCAAVARCLLRASPELKTALAGRASELASAWFTQASDELMRLFLHDDPDGDGVFTMLRMAVKAAGIEGGADLAKREYLIWLWTQLEKREDRLRAIADEAVRVAKDRFAWVRAAVMHAISKTAQKPDLCFDVDTIQGREQALFFPEAQCSKNELGGVWYVGPEPGAARTTHVDGIALPLVRADPK